MEMRIARTGGSKAVLILEDEERDMLDRWARRPSSAEMLSLRSKIMLACGYARPRWMHRWSQQLAKDAIATAVSRLMSGQAFGKISVP